MHISVDEPRSSERFSVLIVRFSSLFKVSYLSGLYFKAPISTLKILKPVLSSTYSVFFHIPNSASIFNIFVAQFKTILQNCRNFLLYDVKQKIQISSNDLLKLMFTKYKTQDTGLLYSVV